MPGRPKQRPCPTRHHVLGLRKSRQARHEWRRDRRLAGADAMRAAACLLVLIHHLVLRIDINQVDPAAQSALVIARFGNFGVSIFFVLSGYLLARPFWRALDEHAPIAGSENLRHTSCGTPPAWLLGGADRRLRFEHHAARRSTNGRARHALCRRLPFDEPVALAHLVSGRRERAALVDSIRSDLLCIAAGVHVHSSSLQPPAAALFYASRLAWRHSDRSCLALVNRQRLAAGPRAARLAVRHGGRCEGMDAALQSDRLLCDFRDRYPCFGRRDNPAEAKGSSLRCPRLYRHSR